MFVKKDRKIDVFELITEIFLAVLVVGGCFLTANIMVRPIDDAIQVLSHQLETKIEGRGSVKKTAFAHTTVVADNSRTPVEIREFWGGAVYGPCIEIANKGQLEPGAQLTLDAAEELVQKISGWISKERTQLEKVRGRAVQSGQHN